MAKILLLDSNSLLNRAFFALPPLINSKGEVTNAVFGYLSMLAKLLKDTAPTHVAAVFDVHEKTFRHKMYEEYKAGRRAALPELISQFPLLKEVLRTMNISILEMGGYEADDIIGTIAKRFPVETIIVSGDKDVLQLVDDSTTVYHTRRGVTDLKYYDLKAMEEEGLTPAEVIEYKALAGDSSDNIPGAKGVGDKTAKQILNDYGTVENLYEHLEDFKGKLKENLVLSKENVFLSKKLATINTHVPIDCDLKDMELKPFSSAVRTKLLELEMKNLVNRFVYEEGAPEPVQEKLIVVEETVDFDRVKEILKTVKPSDVIAVDTGEPLRFTLNGTTEYIASKGNETLFDFASGDGYSEIYALLMRANATKLLFSAKSEMHKLAESGAELCGRYEDLQLMAYLLNSGSVPQKTKDLAKKKGYEGENISVYLYFIYFKFLEEMKEKGVLKLYREVELPLVPVLYDMEKTGFRIDTEVLDALGTKYTDELKLLTAEIHKIAGEEFNINSPQQLGVILFDKFKLPHAKKTQRGYSVSADVLEKLNHPIVSLLLRYRQLQKLNSTYIDGMRQVMEKKTNRVHTVFRQALTTTGRLSSTEPNLQNIPVREAEGREIRKMFVPSVGNTLVTADYSQIELRLLAHFAGDETLVAAYKNAEDIHRETAAKLFCKPVELVTKDERAAAKTVNFSIIYGISNFGLSNRLNISQKETKEFIERYFATYPRVKEYMNENVAFAEKNGYGVTLLGRIRWFPELHSSNYAMREFGKRAAMNMPLQGTASDIIKVAMLKVYSALKKEGLKAKLILQVHDELIVDTPPEESERVAELLKSEMENAVELKVPLIAEVSLGKNWFEAK